MAIQSTVYNLDGSTNKFSSTKHIGSKQHLAVFLTRIDNGFVEQVDIDDYELINNFAVAKDVPDSDVYSQIEVRVADAPNELGVSGSNVAEVASIADEIVIIAGISDDIELYTNTYFGPHADDASAASYAISNGITLAKGQQYFKTSLDIMQVYTGAAWINTTSDTGSINGASNRENFTATDGQTVFVLANSYEAGFADIFVNGLRLVNGVDVDVSTGTQFTLAQGADLNDSISFLGYGVISLDDVLIAVDAVDDLAAINTSTNTTVIVKDSARGGTFNYDASLAATNNGGTIFDGWIRVYALTNYSLTWYGSDNTSISNLTSARGEDGATVIISDSSRGGIFIYDSTLSGTDNNGTIINGWVRQYDGTVNVKWFGVSNSSNMTLAVAVANVDNSSIELYSDMSFTDSSVDMLGIDIIGNGFIISDTVNCLNVGTIHNAIIRGFNTSIDYIAPTISVSEVTPKMLFQRASNILSVVSKRKNGGYIEFEHYYDSYTSGAEDTGVSCLNWRQCVTRMFSDVFLYKETPTFADVGFSARSNMSQSLAFPTDTVLSRPVTFVSTSTINDEIAFTITSSRIGQKGNMAVYSTAGSSPIMELYVNSVLQTTFSGTLVGSTNILLIEYSTTIVGSCEIRLKNVSGNSMNVIGAEFSTLEGYSEYSTIDKMSYGEYADRYVYGTGAADYAFYSSAESKWFGSIHGGETIRSAPVFKIDGADVVVPTVDYDFLVGNNIEIIQKTEIRSNLDFLNMNTYYLYSSDATILFDCIADGDATVTTAYTCMSPTSYDFTEVYYPTNVTLSSGKNLTGRHNTIRQVDIRNSLDTREILTKFTLFPMGGSNGANMASNGSYVSAQDLVYNKLYYGPLDDSEATITNISFQTIKYFT